MRPIPRGWRFQPQSGFNQRNPGFTLIEVMVALAVFAVMAAGMSMAIQNGVGLTERLENKTMAQWVAENQLVSLRAEYRDGRLPPSSGSRDVVTFSRREWVTQTGVKPSAAIPGFVEVTVSVSLKETEDNIIAEVFSFMGQAK